MTSGIGVTDGPSELAKAVHGALAQAKGDQNKATQFLASTVRSNKLLRAALLNPLLEYACGNAVRKAISDNRGRIWDVPRTPSPDQAGRISALAQDNLLLFPLPGGKPLGDATREEVGAAQDFYAKQAKDMAHKARWLELIAQSVSGRKTVRDVLSVERLRELQKEAQDA